MQIREKKKQNKENNKEEYKMRTKKGISLIVLVITIIVMIILAAAIIISLDNSNVINKANQAVSETDIRQVQELANTIWMDAYLDKDITTDEAYKDYVIDRLGEELEDTGKKLEDYYIKVTAQGVTVKAEDLSKPVITISTETTSVQAGGTVVYTVAFSDNEELESVTLTDANITLNGFTATKAITGEGNVRTITLSNVQGEVGIKTITIAAGAATDTSGNTSDATTGGTFAIEEAAAPTLGSLITGPSDYGKIVDYTVTVNEKKCEYDPEAYMVVCADAEVTHDDWQVFYETDEYVFLISQDPVANAPDRSTPMTSSEYVLGTTDVTTTINEKYNIFKLVDNEYTGYTLTNDYVNSKYAASLIANFDSYANKNDYGEEYVIAAIGSPTIELLAAGYNAYHNLSADSANAIKPFFNDFGYSADYNGQIDGIYFKEGLNYHLASPSNYNSFGESYSDICMILQSYTAEDRHFIRGDINDGAKIRPVVCLSSSIPAELGTGDIDFSLDVAK